MTETTGQGQDQLLRPRIQSKYGISEMWQKEEHLNSGKPLSQSVLIQNHTSGYAGHGL